MRARRIRPLLRSGSRTQGSREEASRRNQNPGTEKAGSRKNRKPKSKKVLLATRWVQAKLY